MTSQTITLTINGMTCGHCSRYVSQVINELDGILQTDISLEKGTAIVVYDAEKVSDKQIVAAVSDTHYAVTAFA